MICVYLGIWVNLCAASLMVKAAYVPVGGARKNLKYKARPNGTTEPAAISASILGQRVFFESHG